MPDVLHVPLLGDRDRDSSTVRADGRCPSETEVEELPAEAFEGIGPLRATETLDDGAGQETELLGQVDERPVALTGVGVDEGDIRRPVEHVL